MRIDRLSHAILFCGEEGSGALPLALSLAQYLHCTNKNTVDQTPCGICAACAKATKLIHPDIHFAVPVNKPKGMTGSRPPVTDDFIELWREACLNNPALTEQDWYNILDIENKQGTISVAEAEAMLRKLQFKPFESSVKVMIIWLPERMNLPAGNKLLKILEEPPAGTYFFLVSEHPYLLLPTIRSRCMNIQVPPGHLKAPDKESIRDVEELLDLCLAGKASLVLDWAEDMAVRSREYQKNFVNQSLRLLREYFMIYLDLPDQVRLHREQQIVAMPRIARMNSDFFPKAYEQLNAIPEQIERNVNARPLFCSLAFFFFVSLQK
ncbi:MAG: hypothetical protein WC110_09765 [Bacteroidales bacterium]